MYEEGWYFGEKGEEADFSREGAGERGGEDGDGEKRESSPPRPVVHGLLAHGLDFRYLLDASNTCFQIEQTPHS